MSPGEINTVTAIVCSVLCAVTILAGYAIYMTKRAELNIGRQQEDFADERLRTDTIDALEDLVFSYCSYSEKHSAYDTGYNAHLVRAVMVLNRVGVLEVVDCIHANCEGRLFFQPHSTGIPNE